MHLGYVNNEYGKRVSSHKCDTCKAEFTVCPPIEPDSLDWDNCLSEECGSYDPDRDADILFMSDKEIAKEKKVVSLLKLQQRKKPWRFRGRAGIRIASCGHGLAACVARLRPRCKAQPRFLLSVNCAPAWGNCWLIPLGNHSPTEVLRSLP